MSNAELTLNEIREKGHHALLRDLGAVGFVRFIQQFDSGSGDYTIDRQGWLQNVGAAEIATQFSTQQGPVEGLPGHSVRLDLLYQILRDAAKRGGKFPPLSYGSLSNEYEKITGVSLPPHGTWDEPLWEINRRTSEARPALPPLSALVTYQPEKGQLVGMPGAKFWGSPGVPPKPADPLLEWATILKAVYQAEWPADLP